MCEKYVKQRLRISEQKSFVIFTMKNKWEAKEKLCDNFKNIHGYIGTYKEEVGRT